MKTSIKSLGVGLMFIVFSLTLISFSFRSTISDWEVPAKYKSMKNPVAGEGSIPRPDGASQRSAPTAELYLALR